MRQEITDCQTVIGKYIAQVNFIRVTIEMQLLQIEALMPSEQKSVQPAAEKKPLPALQNRTNLFCKSAQLHQKKYETCNALISKAGEVRACIEVQTNTLREMQRELREAKNPLKNVSENRVSELLGEAGRLVREAQAELRGALRTLETASSDALSASTRYQESNLVGKVASTSKMAHAISVFIVNVKAASVEPVEYLSASSGFSR